MAKTASPLISPEIKDRIEAFMLAQIPPMSMAELARRLDISYAYVWGIISGTLPMSDKFKWRFCEVFGFDLAEPIFGPFERDGKSPARAGTVLDDSGDNEAALILQRIREAANGHTS